MKLASAETLAALMRQRGLGYGRLARYAGCSRGFVSHLCSGRRTSCGPKLAERIAEALDVPLTVLFVPRTVETDDATRLNARTRGAA